MTSPRLLLFLVALVALVAATIPAVADEGMAAPRASALTAAAAEPTDGPTGDPTADPTADPTGGPSETPTAEPTPQPTPTPTGPVVPGTVGGIFTGIDGGRYAVAPGEVRGLEDVTFFGTDFDLACGLGARTTESWKALARLARVIEKSGRRVIWTVAPSKATVLTRLLDPATLPHGACDVAGLDATRRAMDGYRSPGFVHVRKQLSTSKRQVYFDYDPHWTTVGSAIFARAVARRLDPQLAKRQHYRYGTLDFGDTIARPETAQTATPDGRVKVRNAGDSKTQWRGYPEIVFDNSWNTVPAKRTWPGRTLLLGDSFMYYALGAMRPLFARGRFLWAAHEGTRASYAAIKRADTVVLESLQTFLPLGQELSSVAFRQGLKKVLKDAPKGPATTGPEKAG